MQAATFPMVPADPRFQRVLEGSDSAAFELNLKTDTMWISENAAAIMHLDGRVRDWRHHVHGHCAERIKISIAALSIGRLGRFCETFRVKAFGEKTIWVQVSARVMPHQNGNDYVLCGTLRNVTSEKIGAETFLKSTSDDPITGLASRLCFEDAVEQQLKENPVGGSSVFVISIDERYDLGQVLGQANVNAIISAVGTRIASFVRELHKKITSITDYKISRISYNEFAIFLNNIGERGEDALQSIADRIMRGINAPYMIDGFKIFIRVHSGITIFPVDGIAVTDLIENARIAVEMGKLESVETDECWKFYTPNLRRQLEEQCEIAKRLPLAMRTGEMTLHYQPIRCLQTGDILSLEMLPRWTSGAHGSIAPLRFIPIAERYGHMQELGNWLLEQAIAQLDEWNSLGASKNLKMTINLAQRQLIDATPIRFVDILARYPDLSPSRFIFDVRAGDISNDMREQAIRQLNRLADIGCEIHIDDYGVQTFFPNQLQISAVKIVPELVKHILHDATVVQLLVRLGSERGFKVMAKGVETADQKAALIDAKCHFAQGRFFGVPQPPEALERQLLINPENMVFLDFEAKNRHAKADSRTIFHEESPGPRRWHPVASPFR
jgi:EAL domain-containing protein (putative c-di-GMP-specific phosphodiesterase class I)/GGDEF domain-containing protein